VAEITPHSARLWILPGANNAPLHFVALSSLSISLYLGGRHARFITGHLKAAP
jgi:hypothetical protein